MLNYNHTPIQWLKLYVFRKCFFQHEPPTSTPKRKGRIWGEVFVSMNCLHPDITAIALKNSDICCRNPAYNMCHLHKTSLNLSHIFNFWSMMMWKRHTSSLQWHKHYHFIFNIIIFALIKCLCLNAVTNYLYRSFCWDFIRFLI